MSGGVKKEMKKYIGLFALLGASVLSAKTYRFTVLDPSQVGTVQLKPGDYRVQVEGSQVVLKDSRGHQIDTAATMETLDHKAHQTVILSSNADGQRHITSIEFAGSHEKIVFEPAATGTR
jgi:hypothetical protein